MRGVVDGLLHDGDVVGPVVGLVVDEGTKCFFNGAVKAFDCSNGLVVVGGCKVELGAKA